MKSSDSTYGFCRAIFWGSFALALIAPLFGTIDDDVSLTWGLVIIATLGGGASYYFGRSISLWFVRLPILSNILGDRIPQSIVMGVRALALGMMWGLLLAAFFSLRLEFLLGAVLGGSLAAGIGSNHSACAGFLSKFSLVDRVQRIVLLFAILGILVTVSSAALVFSTVESRWHSSDVPAVIARYDSEVVRMGSVDERTTHTLYRAVYRLDDGTEIPSSRSSGIKRIPLGSEVKIWFNPAQQGYAHSGSVFAIVWIQLLLMAGGVLMTVGGLVFVYLRKRS